ncbi:hemolysin-III channel protein Izh2 [Gigaspora rosea]|uniref:Hemolysin-III channel protein Izh2 n=1 Tax=Gigaspora rosea TaxID=44941 RepID=A0A397U0I0_9GLOM|nr:hemolysin-III channel protein Izh2 [Gigaspora rosea]
MAFLGRFIPKSTVIEETTSINSRNVDILDKREENQVNDNINDLNNNNVSNSKVTREITTYGLIFGSKANLLCNFGDLPSWYQDNRDILRGYRKPTSSYIECIYSLFYIHNEFINIWSHFLGAIIFAFLSFVTYFFVLDQPTVVWQDFVVVYTFLSGAVICLGFSSTFHTLCCHSEKVSADWNRCDYVGIVTLIVGSFYPTIYYGFYCDYNWMIFYLSLITILGVVTICVAVLPRFRSPHYRWFRTSLFLAMGLSAIVPLAHGITLYGIDACFKSNSLNYVCCMGLLYVIGALFYGARIPERWYPGTFDIFGSSHQIFHLFVVAAALVHYFGVTQAMLYWHKTHARC